MAKRKTLFMESTEIPATKTAGEVSAALVDAGAIEIATTYKEGRITGLRWAMRIGGHDVLFEMPARVSPILDILKSRYTKRTMSNREGELLNIKAERVAWRQLLRWTEAQVAMLETGMVQPMEVFTAYWVQPDNRTLFQVIEEQKFKALPAPK